MGDTYYNFHSSKLEIECNHEIRTLKKLYKNLGGASGGFGALIVSIGWVILIDGGNFSFLLIPFIFCVIAWWVLTDAVSNEQHWLIRSKIKEIKK